VKQSKNVSILTREEIDLLMVEIQRRSQNNKAEHKTDKPIETTVAFSSDGEMDSSERFVANHAPPKIEVKATFGNYVYTYPAHLNSNEAQEPPKLQLQTPRITDKGARSGHESPRPARVRATNREVVIRWSKTMDQEISVIDLSSSGLCFSARAGIHLPKMGEKCVWYIQIPSVRLQKVTGTVVRKSLDTKQSRINLAIRFDSVTPHLARQISSYIFRRHQQLEKRVFASSAMVLGELPH
jgi:hypothetical protein